MEVPIIIKGAKNFSLKTIGQSLNNNNIINLYWDMDNNIYNGLDAMILAD